MEEIGHRDSTGCSDTGPGPRQGSFRPGRRRMGTTIKVDPPGSSGRPVASPSTAIIGKKRSVARTGAGIRMGPMWTFVRSCSGRWRRPEFVARKRRRPGQNGPSGHHPHLFHLLATARRRRWYGCRRWRCRRRRRLRLRLRWRWRWRSRGGTRLRDGRCGRPGGHRFASARIDYARRFGTLLEQPQGLQGPGESPLRAVQVAPEASRLGVPMPDTELGHVLLEVTPGVQGPLQARGSRPTSRATTARRAGASVAAGTWRHPFL